MKRVIACLLILVVGLGLFASPAFALNTAVYGTISPRTVIAGLASFFLWPGVGQWMNGNETKKIVAHFLLGFTMIFRFWSGWDALIDRHGGRWNGLI